MDIVVGGIDMNFTIVNCNSITDNIKDVVVVPFYNIKIA